MAERDANIEECRPKSQRGRKNLGGTLHIKGQELSEFEV